MTIIFTALATMIVTILAGLVLDYFRKVAPKILYSVKDAVPIDLDEKSVGAYLVSIGNSSKKTIRDVSVNIQANPALLRNGGISCTQGLDYEVDETKEKSIEIKIPFLKEKDDLNVTIIAESRTYVPSVPDVAIRSPQSFKFINASDTPKRKTPSLPLLLPAVVGSLVAATVVFLSTYGIVTRSQQDILTFAATVSDLPHLVEFYAKEGKVRFYHQGDLAYSLAKSSNDESEIVKYRKFLKTALEYFGPRMVDVSEANLHYNLGKIELLLKNESAAKSSFAKAIEKDKSQIQKLINFDDEYRKFIAKEALIQIAN